MAENARGRSPARKPSTSTASQSLKLGIVRGRFDIVTHDEDVARHRGLRGSRRPAGCDADADGRLEVRHQLHGPQGWFKNLMGAVNNSSDNTVVISIALPAGVEVEAGTVSGDGLVSGITGHTRLNTVSGSVMSDGTSGDLHVNTVSGEVIARNHRGCPDGKERLRRGHGVGPFQQHPGQHRQRRHELRPPGLHPRFRGKFRVRRPHHHGFPTTSAWTSWPNRPAARW